MTRRTYICGQCRTLQTHSLAMCSQCYSRQLVEIDVEATNANVRRTRRIRRIQIAGAILIPVVVVAYTAATGTLELSDILRMASRLFTR